MFKKIFSGFVSATTIAWSVGAGALALPSVASAATAGDLVKASGPAVYYYHTDGKRYVFPNEKTYFSWFKDFSSVKTISDSELASIFVGGNVTVRPGTYLAKVTTDPKVYAVSHDGKFHWIESEAIAKALYGDNWAQRVIDVPDAFFINYTVGASISTAVHPDGTVVSKDGSKWVIASGKARMIASDAVFASNGYNAAFTIPTTIAYTADSSVTAREGRLADVIFGAGTPVSGNITVALASDTPAGMTVPKNASSVMLAKYNFTAGSTDAMLTGLRVRRVGVGATTDLANVYVYDANGARITTGRTINSQTNEVEFNNLNISIPAGQTKSLVITGDFSSPVATGGQHSFQVMNASAVITGGVVSGSFPVAGNVFTVGTISAAVLEVTKGTTPSNPNTGTMQAEISNFKLEANTNDIEVRRITLLQAGNISNSDLKNLNLYQGATLVATAASVMGDKIVLNFNPPVVIPNGTTRTFSLKADVSGRSDRDIETYIEYTTDVYAIDKLYNSGASVDISGFDNSNSIVVDVEGGALTIAANGPATGNVAKGTQNVQFFKFSITSSESDVEIRNLDFSINAITPGAAVKGSNSTEYFRNFRVKNLDNGVTLMGPTAMPAGTLDSATTAPISLNESFYIPAGTTLNLVITADLANSEDAGGEFFDEQFRVTLGNGVIFGGNDVRINATSEYLDVAKIIPNSNIQGNPMTIKTSSLDVSLAANPAASIAVKKQQMIPATGLVLTSGAQSDVTVRSVKLSGLGRINGGGYTAANFAQVVTACDLYNGDTKVGNTQSIDTTNGTIQITNMNLLVAAGTSKSLIVKCTADSVVSAGVGDHFRVGVANNATDIVAEDADNNTLTLSGTNAEAANASAQNVKNGGVVTVIANSLRQSTILVADGSTWQNIASYKATALYEAVNVDRVRVILPAGIESASVASIAIAQNGAEKGVATLDAGNAGVEKDIILTTPIMIAKDSDASFQIWVKLAPVVSEAANPGAGIARSGNLVQAGIKANVVSGEWNSSYGLNNFNIRMIGQASGDLLHSSSTMDVVGNEFVVRKTKPTVTRQALSTATLANGTDRELHKFQVSADANGPAALKEVTFDVNYSNATALSGFRLKKGSSIMNTLDVNIQDETGVDLSSNTLTGGQVIVTFTNEEAITGSGVVYTLIATVGGSVSGDQVSVDFARAGSNAIVTDEITLDANDGVEIDATNEFFVWSDNSETPHSDAYGTSSADWINDVYLEDLLGTSLTR